MFELREGILDGVEVGGVFRQKEELGAGGADERTAGLMASKIVHDDDVAWFEGGGENLLDVGPEALAIDGALEKPGSIDPVVAHGGEEGHGVPASIGNLGLEPLAARGPASERRHIGSGPGLIDEDQALGVDPALILSPLRPTTRNVRTILLAGVHGFF